MGFNVNGSKGNNSNRTTSTNSTSKGFNVNGSLGNSTTKPTSTNGKSKGFNVNGSLYADQVYEIKLSDNLIIGNLSYGATKAIESNTLDSYKPKNDEEKKSLEIYKQYLIDTQPKKTPTKDKSTIVISDYVPGAYSMTKSEYNRRRQANPDMPEFGSYEYFKQREATLRPFMEEIANDFERRDDVKRAWVDNYLNDENWLADADEKTRNAGREEAERLSNKFKYQDDIIAEYKGIDEQLKKFETDGVHYDKNGNIDTKSGSEEAKYARERYDTILSADAFTDDEFALGFRGQLPEDKQEKYDNAEKTAKLSEVEYYKEKAYTDYENDKDKVYDDNFGGRVTGNYKIGRIDIKKNNANYSSYNAGVADLEAADVYNALSERIQQNNAATFQNNTKGQKLLSTLSQYAPQAVDQLTYEVIGIGVGLATGTYGIGNFVGSAGSAGYMYRQTAGASFERLLRESDLSVEDAKILAGSEALASGTVEFGLSAATGLLWKTANVATKGVAKGVVSEFSETATKRAVAGLMAKGISEKGANIIVKAAITAGKVAIDATGEGIEEWIQEGMSITTDRLAKEGKTASAFDIFLNSFDLSQYSASDFSRMNQSFLAGTIIGFGHGGFRATTSAVTNKTISKAANAIDATILGREIIKTGNVGIIENAIDNVRDNATPEVAKAIERIETAISNGKKPSATDVGTVVKSALTEENLTPTVAVGDSFTDTKTGKTITVKERNDTYTVVDINTGTKTFTKKLGNPMADELVTNDRYERMETTESVVDTAPVTSEAVATETVAETPTVVVEDKSDNSLVVEAINSTLKDGAKETIFEDMANASLPQDISIFAESLANIYKQTGTIGHMSQYFSDGGKSIIDAIDGKTATSEVVTESETISETETVPDEVAIAENATPTTEATDEIKGIENLAIQYGANNATRAKIASALTALQNKLSDTDISVKSVFNGVQNLLAHSGITMDNEKTSKMFWKQASLNLEAYAGENYTVDDIRHLLSVRNASEDKTPTEAENAPTTDETTSANEGVTTNDVELAEGEILSLKRTKNIYSVFKGAKRIIVGKDVISDSYVVIPFSEEALEQVKKVAKKADVQNMPDLALEKFYNKNNDVVIQGDPKVNKVQHDDYIFNINGKYYIAQQKYIDAFNNGKNVIKANSKTYSVPWTVHDKDGNFVALFCPVSNDKMTDEIYNDLQSVSEIKAEKTKDKVSPETKTPETNTVADDVESVETQPEETENENSNVTETPESVTETAENEIDNTSQNENVSESTPTLTDKCVMYETAHTKTGAKLWVISLKDKISSDEYKTLSGNVKKVGGYYSRFTKTADGTAMPGFVFTTEPNTDVIKTFNDFFNVSDELSKSNEENNVDNKLDNSEDKVLQNQPESDTMEEKTTKESVDNVEPQSEVLAGESGNDDRGLRSEPSESTEQETNESVDGQSGENGGELLPQSTGRDGNRPDDRNDSEGVHGRNDADVSESGIGGIGTEIAEETPETIETEDKSIEKKRPSNKENFVITDDIAREFDNTPPSAEDNIKAIELLLTLENEGRPATAEEKKILAKYKGWGGIDIRRISWELSRKLYDLFDGQQLREMQSSQNNAFFTPTGVIDAMYNGLKRMGFKGGNVLESSMGVGNFFGRMPAAMTAKSALTGVELESYTARIAQYLYPGATVINKPFQDVAIRNGSFDLVIGNVPFGTNKISYNKKKYSLHNYFIVSSLDKVKDGGIVAVITSSGTLDSYSMDARSAIMDRADVVACYKLPAGVFSRNASTDVQTDLLILRKRASDAKPSGDSILNVTTTDDGLRLNEYFVKHPENILGTLAKGTNAWGEITTVLDNGGFYDKLNEAMSKLPKDLISGKVELKPIETIVSTGSKPRFFEKNGKIYADDGAGTATAVPTTQEKTVRDYMVVRDAYKDLLAAYESDVPEVDIKPLRDKLTKVYDDFYKNHGAITGDGKKKIGTKKSTNNTFLEADADYYLVSGLERYNADERKFEKSALFEKDTLRKKKVTSVDASSDALAVSLNESGKIDFARMSELTGKTEKQLAEELKGEIVLTPDGEYVLTDIYLSGNIYEKLEAVKDKPEFKEQKEMLEKVLPTPKDASSIMVKLGANYIDTKYIEQFSREVFNTRIEVSKNSSGEWLIEGVRQSRYGDILNVKYGCSAFNAIQLLEKVLNDSEITAKKTVKVDGKSVQVYDEKMTEVARQKAEDIKEAFENWIFRDSERRTDIVDKYNRTYNNYRPLNYEYIADKLSFDSMDKTLKGKLYPHQKKGIARFLFGGNILFAHGVGTGKTFEMIASVMEAKRMGIINKVAMVVPNNKVVDFKKDIAQAYPNAKVLVIDTANKKRQTMLGLVNSNDWDIVLIARTTFTKIPVSPELQSNYINQQLEELDRQIAEAESDRNISKRKLKGLYTQRDNLEQKLKDLDSETKRDENSVDFEKLGFDCICVDEAHNYKSITTLTKLDIKGLASGANAQQANDMLMKLDYMRSVDGRIIFGTGTPITNTVSEIYNMMRMVRPDILEDAGIHSLDEWVNTFAKIDTHTEIGVDNKVKNKSTQTIRSFVNCTEMVGMFRQFADVVFTQDVVKNLPKAKHITIEVDGTPELRQVESKISEVISGASGKETLSAYTKAMAMANAAAIDLKMLSGAESDVNIFKDYSVEELEYENSKINTMCNYVYDEYKASNNIRGTQIIFCDGGAGSGDIYSFNVHNDIVQKLVERGIPKEEIVIVKNQKDAQLEELFEKVNSGEVRVLIGTSRKMAEGLNVQKRVVAIHHPTVTFKPSDLEQGDARGVRAGNINKEVRIYRYLQANTFDSYKWQAIDRKGEMINKALRGETVDELEDIGADDDSDAGVDAATAMAITSGNPLVKEKIDIDKEVKRLKTLKQNFMNEYYRYADAVAKNPNKIRQLTEYAQRVEQDIALRNKSGDKAKITVKGKVFEKQTDANKALVNAVNSAPKNGQFTKIGEYNGFDIMFKGDTGGLNYALVVKGANEYSVEYAGSGNNIARIDGILKRLDGELTRVQSRVETLKSDLEFAKQEVNKPFEQEKALAEALEKQKDITYRYEHFGEKQNAEQNETEDATEVENVQYSIESGEDYERARNLLHNDSEQRYAREHPWEQVAGLAKAAERGSETASERKAYTAGLKPNQLDKKVITDKHGNKHMFVEIKSSSWNDQMNRIADYYAQKDVNVHFIKGGVQIAFVGEDKVANAMRIGNDIYISYDNVWFTPEQLSMHEYIHIKYGTPEFQKIVQDILAALPKREYNKLVEKVKKAYGDIIANPYAYEQELICDVLSGMTPSSLLKSGEVVLKFWIREGADMFGYDASQYAESIDAGGTHNKYRQFGEYVVDEGYSTEGTKWAISNGLLTKGEQAKFWEDIAKLSKRGYRSIPKSKNGQYIIDVGQKLVFTNGDFKKTTIDSIIEFSVEYESNIHEYKEWIIDEERHTAQHGASIQIIEIMQGTGYVSEHFPTTYRTNERKNGRRERKHSEKTVSLNIEQEIDYSLATDGIPDLEDLWNDAKERYGTIPKGEKPARDIEVPRKISTDKVVSRYARTMLEAGVTIEEAVSEFEEAILDGTMTHEVVTDKNAEEKAIARIQRDGFQEALRDWESYSKEGAIDKEHFALGLVLYNECITNKDVSNAMKLAAELVAEASRAGQVLQSTRMLKKMTPDGQLYYLEKSIQKINEEFKQKLGEKYKDIELDEELMGKFLNEQDEDVRDEIYDEICQDIADQLPATKLEKWNAWRYLAMLGNPRTHFRNIWGNAVFVPSVKIKNYIGATMESIAKVDTADRTKSWRKSKEAVEFAKQDAIEMKKILQGNGDKYAVTDDIGSKRTIYETKWLEYLREKNFEFLEKEDWWFLKMHYTDALARIITARKLDVNSITPKQLETIRGYAIAEAKRATYRDANALADGLNALQRKLGRSNKKAVRASSILIESVMPFKKTPMNIVKQGLYYSPVGILKGIYTAATKLKKGDATVTEVIDDLSKGMSGTMMLLLGYFLSSMGILIGGEDKEKKEKEFDEMTGEQDYAIKIGDFSYTIDWATPSNLSLFIGAKLHDLAKDEFSFADITSSFSTLTEPLLELSVFSGVNDVIESAKYSEGNATTAIISNIVTSYFTQALPTIGGQISRLVDDNKREYYYTDKTSNVPKGLQRLIGQASSKIPFAGYLFGYEPEIDEWGREETYGNFVERLFENTVSPGYVSKENYTAVDKELRKLYDKTGDSSILPTIQQKYYTEDYVKYDMTAKEYTEVKKLRGKKSYELLRNLFSGQMVVNKQEKPYSSMTDKEKIDAISKCYRMAGDDAKEKMIDKVKRKSK